MPQLPLFESSAAVLADDERGRIVYSPAFVAPSLAEAWFAELRRAVPWKAERRWMYDREVDVPRLTAHYHLAADGLEDGPVPDAVRRAAERVAAHTGVPFNSAGLNLYRDGHDSVAPHNDHLDALVEGFPLALLSLGATRRMTIRARSAPRKALHVDLEGGSLLTMSHATQRHYDHGVPKTADAVGERISLVFRVKPAAGAGAAAPYR